MTDEGLRLFYLGLKSKLFRMIGSGYGVEPLHFVLNVSSHIQLHFRKLIGRSGGQTGMGLGFRFEGNRSGG